LFPVVIFLKYVVTEVVNSSHEDSGISQGSVATHLRCSGIFSDSLITNVLLIQTVNKVSVELHIKTGQHKSPIY